jgi:hypothetical protein
MRNALGLAAALLAAACAAEEPPRVSPETVEAAVEHAQLELERAPAPAPERSTRPSR